jgi:hypothetical protein
MSGQGIFLKAKNFHSIVIVVPLHVSNFSGVLKKLTASPGRVFHFGLFKIVKKGLRRGLKCAAF